MSEVERSLIGGLLNSPSSIDSVRIRIKQEDFSEVGCGIIYGAMLQLGTFDIVTISDHLRNSGNKDLVIFVTDCMGYGIPTMIDEYAKIIVNESRLRRLTATAERIKTLAQEKGNSQEIIRHAENELISLYETDHSKMEHIKEGLIGFVSRLAMLKDKKSDISGMTTGFRRLDVVTDGLRNSELVIIGARPSIGKAQPLDSNILTPKGFVKMGSIRIGDYVIGSNGMKTMVLGVYPQGKIPVYRCTFSDNTSTECCGEHLWYTQTRNEKRFGDKWSVKKTHDIIDTLYTENGTRMNHKITLVKPVQYQQSEELGLNPYLLGLILGDGSTYGNIVIHNPEEDILEKIINTLPEGDTCEKHGTLTLRIKNRIRTKRPSKTKAEITRLGLLNKDCYSKFIPKKYLLSSIENRLELLRGLMDTDGYVNISGQSYDLSFSSKELAYNTRELVLSLGGTCSITNRIPSFSYLGEKKYGAVSYRMCISFHNGIVPVSSKKHMDRIKNGKAKEYYRSFVSIEPIGDKECMCIKVDSDDSLYVTDDFIVTHNTSLMISIALHVALELRGRVAVFSVESPTSEIINKMISQQAKVSTRKLRTGQLSDDEHYLVGEAVDKIASADLFITDFSLLDIYTIRYMLKKMINEGNKPDILFIDYLQLMKIPEGRENRYVRIGLVVKQLKAIAKEMNIPVVCCSQLNRTGVEEPKLEDLRESGDIEQEDRKSVV